MRKLAMAAVLLSAMLSVGGCGQAEKKPTIGGAIDKAVDDGKAAAKDLEKKAEKVKKDLTQ
jgi:hypothetical protein